VTGNAGGSGNQKKARSLRLKNATSAIWPLTFDLLPDLPQWIFLTVSFSIPARLCGSAA
jgi:hypothetical protein